jgi:hypothetical protein
VVDGKNKPARNRRKQAWIITGIILVAYACYAVWDIRNPYHHRREDYWERIELGSLFGVEQAYVPEGLECLVGEIQASRNGTELHFGASIYIRSDKMPRAHIEWDPYPQVLDEKLLPDDIRSIYEDARSVCATYALSLPWYILRRPAVVLGVGSPSTQLRIAALVSGRCRLRVVSDVSNGIEKWERYYEGPKTSDGFQVGSMDSLLHLYVDDDWITAAYLHWDDDYYTRMQRDAPVHSEIALFIRDGKSVAIAEDGSIVDTVFDELQESLPSYIDYLRLRSLKGTAPDDLTWSRLERGLNALTMKPESIHITKNLQSILRMLQNGPYHERNLHLALDEWEIPYAKLADRTKTASLRLPSDHLLIDKTYEYAGLKVQTAYSSYLPVDKALISQEGKRSTRLQEAKDRACYSMLLGSPAYITRSDEYGQFPISEGLLSRTWFVDLERSFATLVKLPEKDEPEYGEMKQLVDKLAEGEKELGEFGANPWVRRFINEMQARRVSYRRSERGTTYSWESIAEGDETMWILTWMYYDCPTNLYVSLGPKDFQISWPDNPFWSMENTRISPSTNGYTTVNVGQLQPLGDAEKESARALIKAVEMGVVKVPDEVKGGWNKLFAFVEVGMKTVGARSESFDDRQMEQQLMELLN